MEATFDISDGIMECLRQEADRSGITMSALVEAALRMALPQGNLPKTEPPPEPVQQPLPPLPTWKAELLVDVANREELYRVLDDNPKFKKLYRYHPGRAPEERE